LPRVFDRFFQVSEGERRKAGGVGIGLALAQELATLHGGELRVSSRFGEGTTFSLHLRKGKDHFADNVIERRQRVEPGPHRRRPVDFSVPSLAPTRVDVRESPVTPPTERPIERAKGSARVLVVDDHDDLRQFLARTLGSRFDVREAVDGDDALSIMATWRPDLVVSDVMMPGKSGTELSAEIKSNPKYEQIPIILLTARVGSDATLEAYAHGADDFIAKPFHPNVLIARVDAQLKIRQLGRKLVNQEKLFAVGSLAAGVAHEVRNPINAILNAARTLAEVELDKDTANKLHRVIIDGSSRVERIIAALDAHARPTEQSNAEPWSHPAEGLRGTLELLAHRMKGISVETNLIDEVVVAIPSGPLNQVLLNLLDNSIRSGATAIKVSMGQEGGVAVIDIRDNGPGVPAEIADRIFEPFFTTRGPSQGTGLGLHLSRSLLVECRGDLELIQDSQSGAHFRIKAPLHQAAA
ncbi:MAG: response regulator, partial [Myxococcales bacterium]|nr:response regulator [Myxococcales bacterium]